MNTIILYTEPRTGQIRGYVRLAGGGEFATAYPTRAALDDAIQSLRRSGEAHSITLDRNPMSYQADRKPAE
jgi:hypothetical protein